MGHSYCVVNAHDALKGLEEVIRHFKINVRRHNVFSLCMLCGCDDFLVASKLDMIKTKYCEEADVPEELRGFLLEPEKYSFVGFPERKKLWSWTRFEGQQKTKHGVNIQAQMADGTLNHFQTFYICQKCSKVFWDGGHYENSCGGKLDFIFDQFPEAADATK